MGQPERWVLVDMLKRRLGPREPFLLACPADYALPASPEKLWRTLPANERLLLEDLCPRHRFGLAPQFIRRFTARKIPNVVPLGTQT
jgi:hypothetical protein